MVLPKLIISEISVLIGSALCYMMCYNLLNFSQVCCFNDWKLQFFVYTIVCGYEKVIVRPIGWICRNFQTYSLYSTLERYVKM